MAGECFFFPLFAHIVEASLCPTTSPNEQDSIVRPCLESDVLSVCPGSTTVAYWLLASHLLACRHQSQ